MTRPAPIPCDELPAAVLDAAFAEVGRVAAQRGLGPEGFTVELVGRAVDGLWEDESREGLTFHDLRHTVATIFRQAGIDACLVADSLGQGTEGMALHHSREADLWATMEGVGKVFEASETRARAGRKLSKRSGRTVRPEQSDGSD